MCEHRNAWGIVHFQKSSISSDRNSEYITQHLLVHFLTANYPALDSPCKRNTVFVL